MKKFKRKHHSNLAGQASPVFTRIGKNNFSLKDIALGGGSLIKNRKRRRK